MMYKYLIATLLSIALVAAHINPVLTIAGKITFFIFLLLFSYNFIKMLIPKDLSEYAS